MMIFTMLALLLNPSNHIARDNQNATQYDVTSCDAGSMTLDSSGWLHGSNGRISYHSVMADPGAAEIPDHVYTESDASGQPIHVCRMFDKLHYFVTR